MKRQTFLTHEEYALVIQPGSSQEWGLRYFLLTTFISYKYIITKSIKKIQFYKLY